MEAEDDTATFDVLVTESMLVNDPAGKGESFVGTDADDCGGEDSDDDDDDDDDVEEDEGDVGEDPKLVATTVPVTIPTCSTTVDGGNVSCERKQIKTEI